MTLLFFVLYIESMKQVLNYSPEVVKSLRKAQGLTIQQVAEKSGVPLQTLYKIERGQRNPRLETLRKLAEFFNVVFC